MNREKRKTRRPGRPEAGKTLTPAAVAEAAAKLIDAGGMPLFSMRRLGQALGVEAMAVYNHVEDKEDLLDAVASLALSKVPQAPAKGSWRNRIKSVAFSIRQLAGEHPNLFRLAMTRRAPPLAGLPLTESVLAAFADAGLTPHAQAVAYHTCFLYIRGFCLWEIEEIAGARERESARIPEIPRDYPRATAAREWLLSSDLNRLFEAGLDAILQGLSD